MATTIAFPTREYADVDFLFGAHPVTKNVFAKKNINAVKQAIIHLMLLKTGDKPFHPEISSPIYNYFFDNLSFAVSLIMEDEVKKYINYYEPRVNVTHVSISFPNPNGIYCYIEGIILNIQEPFTVNVLVDRLR